MNKIVKRIKESQHVEYLLFNKIPILIKDKTTNQIDFNKLVDVLEKTIPYSFRNLVKSIKVLDDPIFDQRKINALYKDDEILLSNKQDDLNDILDDIVHEFAHALDKKLKKQIYSDNEIKKEFLSKREQLQRILNSYDFEASEYDFANVEFDYGLDNFLLNVVGYEKIKKLTNYGLFINPYAATSLKEYFATGLEEYILGDHIDLKNISPKLYEKIKQIL